MNNHQRNRQLVLSVAKALEELNERVVFVGGTVLSLYIDDPSAMDARPTKDVDFTVEIATLGELEQLRVDLDRKGFRQSHEDQVICRFRYEDYKVNVMSTKEIGWAPANPWFAPGFPRRIKHQLDDIEIYLLPLSYWLATKFEAFASRGGGDPRTSHDFEDIIYILTHTSYWKDAILEADTVVKQYLISQLKLLHSAPQMQEGILAHLPYDSQQERFEAIMENLEAIVTA